MHPATSQTYGTAGGGNIAPSAPPLKDIKVIPGYEGSNFDQHNILPPPGYYDPGMFSHPLSRPVLLDLPVLNEEIIREAVLDFVSENCPYGKTPAQEMKILGFESGCEFHYMLETFTEQRETKWAFEPYTGDFLDSPMNGATPHPWDVPIPEEIVNYQNLTKKVQVPHTESVSQCHNCQGQGAKTCHKCLGKGNVGETCTLITTHQEGSGSCTACNDTGLQKCGECSGLGQIKCSICKAKGQLKCFIELTVKYTNHEDNFLAGGAPESESLTKKLLDAKGQEVFSESGLKVFPIPNFSHQGILNASHQLLQKHERYFTTERVHAQRHKIRAIPITKVFSQYKEKERTFYVYGLENAVEFEDYYSKCGACCCII